MLAVSPDLATENRIQRTIKAPATYSGIGIHTGTEVAMRFVPAEEGAGIFFKRTDLASKPIIPATLEYVCDTSRSTSLGVADVRIHTVEHVLAAVKALDIDNLCIEVSSIEPPIGNGSSDIFIKMIQEAGVVEQKQMIPVVKLEKPVYYSDGEIHIVAIPYDGYKISYTLSYPNSKILKAQYQTFEIDSETFIRELSPCRTFSQYEEISTLIDRGLIKGGSLDNAVIVKDDVIFSKEGLYFPDEMVRHKILDMVGDLTLVGFNFHAHIISLRSGHKTNIAFASKLLKALTLEEK